MGDSRNSRKGLKKLISNSPWKKMFNGSKKAKTRSALTAQKYFGINGVEDLPHRHEYSNRHDARYY